MIKLAYMDIQSIKTKITPILEDQGVVKAAIFGSYATGEAKANSDIDLLVQFEDALNKKVDLLTYNSIHPYLKRIILNEQKVIYEKRS